ncbi:hypothetical protein GOBAR_AA02200 [Gossypium barbadense]|uniref:Inner centromere protein ARK-binding domain-containing protein n=1 Tax=Gossypium barbadense TaxID=3634 RepID=A0A2P5YRZ9_GOSBA|nr:hypothetical protein GOBAR_AA02200 [Gossypium barbadense]
MSTIENVLIQIFERKNRIIDNVKQQILLFDHQLASKCLIDGFVPPPWLLSSSSFELNTDDLISGLLLPHSQHSIPYCSLYQQPVVTTDNVQLPHVLCSGVGVDASNEGLDKFLSGKTDQLDPSVTSPQDCRDGMVSDICPDPCLSLARIQRSKSRQRALEHRNSAKVCKNVESFDKNDDACNSQNKVSKIASLMSGPVDKLELIRSGDNVVSYEVEKEERGQCRSKERSEYFYSGRVTRSSSVQPSKPMGGPSGAGNTSCVAEQYEVAPMESICKSGQHHVSHEFLEPKVAEPVDNTESCLVKNEARGPCWSQERGEDICSGGITRSRSSVHPPMSVNCPPSAGKNFCVAKQDGILLTESINKSRQQPDAADELLQFVKPVENVVTFVVAKQERDQYPSKERGGSIYSGRVTRSRSSVRSPNSVDGLLCVGKPSEGATCDKNMLIECISRSKAQPDVVDKSLALVRPTVISNETCGSRKARDHRSKERGNNVYQGRLTRSRSSSQYQTMENDVVDQYNDGSTGSRPNHSAKLFKLDSSNTLENKVRQSKSTSSNQFLYAKSSERSEGVELSSGTQVDSLPCIDGSGLAELNQCDAFVAETDANSGELVEASASSASNLDGGNNPSLIKSLNRYEGVELEVIGKSQQSSSAIKVLPKQLDFIDLGDCTVKEASSLLLKSENMINSLDKKTTGQSLKEKMESSPQNQDEVAMGRCIAGDTGSVLDQKHAKSSDKVAVQSIRLGKHSRSHVEGSWSHKRRKVDGQQCNSLSLSLNLKEEDAMQLNAKLLVDEEQNGGKYNRNERGRSENTPSNFIHKQFDVASVSSSPLANLENFDQSEDAPGTVYPSSIMFDSTRKCTADENQIILNVGDNSDFANIEHLACDERSKKESKCHLGEDGEFSTFLISSPCRPPRGFISADQSRPELEGFIIQTEDKQICNGGEGIGFEKLHLSNPTIERASLLEQLCKSACTRTPLPQFPTTCRMHQATECMDPRSTFPENSDSSHLKISSSCFAEETNHALLGGCFSDCLPLSSSQLIGNVKNPYLSPVGKFWDRITSNSDSSEKRGSLKLELPCINEENENTEEVVDAIHFQEGTASKRLTCSAKRVPLAEIMECPNAPSVSGAEIFHVRDSLDSVNTAYSFIGTENGIKQKVEKQNATKRRDINKSKENCSIGPGMTTTKRTSESLRYKFSKPKLSQKTNPRKGGPSFSEKELKLNNIVSNVTSFIPLVQQKQAASIATGKRDVKVKALEAAEAAKKLAEKKENDRKMKKEALKLERKRLREEEERLEKERKRKRIEEARRQRCAPEDNLCSKKDGKEKKCQAPDERAQTIKVPNGEALKLEKMQRVGTNEGKMSATEISTAVSSTTDAVKTSTASEDFHAKAMSTLDRAKASENNDADITIEQSYDISPYKVKITWPGLSFPSKN